VRLLEDSAAEVEEADVRVELTCSTVTSSRLGVRTSLRGTLDQPSAVRSVSSRPTAAMSSTARPVAVM
jgi:hypothetical protein